MTKAAAARRKEVLSKNQNRRQLPVYIQDTDSLNDTSQAHNHKPIDVDKQGFYLPGKTVAVLRLRRHHTSRKLMRLCRSLVKHRL